MGIGRGIAAAGAALTTINVDAGVSIN